MKHMSGLTCSYQSVVGAGDLNQNVNRVGEDKEARQDRPLHQAVQALRGKCVMARADRNPYTQVEKNRETNRFGQPHLSFLRILFSWMNDVTTRADHETNFYPVFFAFSKNLYVPTRDKKYIRREESIFITTLLMVGLECVINARIGGRSIAVICNLACVQEDLEEFFKEKLAKICAFWHETIFPDDKNFSIAALWERVSLSIMGPFEVKGKTADVVFLLSQKRSPDDYAYAGLMTEKQLLGMHYTRVKHRMYTFIHDLTWDRWERESTSSSKRPRTDREWAQAQKMEKSNAFYNEVKILGREIWRDCTVKQDQIGHWKQTRYNFREGLEEALPFFYSPKYRSDLLKDLGNHTDYTVSGDFWNNDWWRWNLQAAEQFYEEMGSEGKWPYARVGIDLPVQQNSLDDINWWHGLFKDDEQCRRPMITDHRRDMEIWHMRTEKQYAEDADSQGETRPKDEQVFDAWRNCMLDCSSIALTSEKDCTICLPFSTLQFAEIFNQGKTMPMNITYPKSAGWLARALAQSTEIEFTKRGDPFSVYSDDVT